MKRTTEKYQKSAIRMNQALLTILETKDFADITVKEVCEQAGVNRSTFYLHYESISDLLTETIEHISARFHDSFRKKGRKLLREIQNASLEEILLMNDEILVPYLEFVRSNQAVVRAAYNNPIYMQVDSWTEFVQSSVLEPMLVRFEIPGGERKYWKCYYLNGIQAIVKEWLQNGCRESVEEIEQIIHRCIRPDLSHFLQKEDPALKQQ